MDLNTATWQHSRRNEAQNVEGDSISAMQQELRQLSAEVALLKAQSTRGTSPVSPWVSIKEAALRLNYRSERSLRTRIKKGQFPPDCVRVDPSLDGVRTRYLVNVERYIKLLR